MANTTKEMTVFRVPLADGTTQEYEIVDATARASLQNKQNTLTFDSTPTANSTNPITSGGVYTAISNISPSSGGSSNNSTVEMEWINVYSQWQAGYYYDPDNDFAYTQIPSTETTWGETQTYIATSCTPYSDLIPVKAGEKWRYQNMPIHFDSKNAEVPSVIIFDSNKAEIQAYTRTYQDEWTEFTIPTNGVWMAVLYANSQTYYLQKYDVQPFNKKELVDTIMADYRSYSLTVPPTPRTLTKALICLGTDDIRPAQTKKLHELFTTNNIPYYMASIPPNLKACITDDPYKTNLDYMRLCVQNGGEIICHSADVITENNKNDFDAMYTYFGEFKRELEFYGFKVRGIFKAGGEGSIYYPSDPLIDAWAAHYYEFGDYFRDAFPYNLPRTILEQWESYSGLASTIQNIVENHGYYIGTMHIYHESCVTAIEQILAGLSGYTRGVDYDFVTPSQLFDTLMPTTIPTGGGGSGVDTNTTYRLSMASNTITLTGSDSSTSTITLPVYNGEVTT